MNYSTFETVDEFKNSDFYKSYVADKIQQINEKKDLDDKSTKTIVENPMEEEVIYADLKRKPTCKFKNIIVFTNNRSKDNKTLENIKAAIEALPEDEKPKLYVFVAANAWSEDEGKVIYISDDKKRLKIDKQTNLDTLVFSRLGVQGEPCCESSVKLLQDRGLLVLNPVRYSEVACDKLETAYLLEKAGLPQPRFCEMTKDVVNTPEMYEEAMQRIFPEFKEDSKDNKNLMVVVKILDGHGGTGVFMIDCKRLKAVLQTIFAIDPERTLIIQKKEEGDGGDIRVHVLTLRDKQIILGAMKREQLGGDFRSNVSLGAEAVPVKLSKEQEQIALKAARVSKLPWAAIDIMPLVKDSNPEIGDNVILELNASPGTQGISDVLGVNFINVLLNELQDPSEFKLQLKTAGYLETVTVDFGGHTKDFLAKLDTGNSTPACTLEVGEFEDTGKAIKFTIDGKEYEYEKINELKARTPGGHTYNKPMIKLPSIQLGQRKLADVPVTIVENRDHKISNMLLNRDVIGRLGYTVDPSARHILTDEIQKVKILN